MNKKGILYKSNLLLSSEITDTVYDNSIPQYSMGYIYEDDKYTLMQIAKMLFKDRKYNNINRDSMSLIKFLQNYYHL